MIIKSESELGMLINNQLLIAAKKSIALEFI